MNKKMMLIIAGVVLIAVLAGLVFFMTQDDTNSDSQSNNSDKSISSTNNNSQTEEHSEEQGNILTLSGGGKTRQCNLSYSGANGSGKGTIYTDGKGRGLMTLSLNSTDGKTGQSNTLVTGDKVYSWTTTGDKTLGFVFGKEKFNANSSSSSSTTTDINQKYDLDCHNWSVEEAKLTVPANINFTKVPI